MRTWPALPAGELELTDVDEVLWRQLTKVIWDEDLRQPGLMACGPQASDRRKPSFSQGSVVTAQAARDWHQNNAASSSYAVWSITVGDVIQAGLRAIDDSAAPLGPDEKRAPGHAYADYQGLAKGEMKDARANLLRAMLSRGEERTTDCGFVGTAA